MSVILPPYNRPDRLARAIDPVRAQRYGNWELIVVDDGGEVGSESVVTRAADERIRWIRREHGGVCAARNAVLALARGEIIAYLDDDNLMDSGWLWAVAWIFGQRPDCDVLYGAIVIDDLVRFHGESSDFPRPSSIRSGETCCAPTTAAVEATTDWL